MQIMQDTATDLEPLMGGDKFFASCGDFNREWIRMAVDQYIDNPEVPDADMEPDAVY